MADYPHDPLNYLKVRWGGDDGDGIGRLTVAAAANGYAGKSAAWFNRTVILAFAVELGQFPLATTPAATLSGGFGGPDGRAQEHVGMAAAPAGSHGQVGIAVHLSSEVWPDTRARARHEVRLELLTTYERLRHFSGDVAAMLDGRLNEAELGGEQLIGS